MKIYNIKVTIDDDESSDDDNKKALEILCDCITFDSKGITTEVIKVN